MADKNRNFTENAIQEPNQFTAAECEQFHGIISWTRGKILRLPQLRQVLVTSLVVSFIITASAAIAITKYYDAEREAYFAEQQSAALAAQEEVRKQQAELRAKKQEEARQNVEAYDKALSYIYEKKYYNASTYLDDIEDTEYKSTGALLAYCLAQRAYESGRIWDADYYIAGLSESDFSDAPDDIAAEAMEFRTALRGECDRQKNAKTKPYVGMAEADVRSTDYGKGYLMLESERLDLYARATKVSMYIFFLSRTKMVFVDCENGVVTHISEYEKKSSLTSSKPYVKPKYAAPYVGMYEEDINNTSYGEAELSGEYTITDPDGGTHISHPYYFYNGLEMTFCAECVDGRVVYVKDYSKKKSKSKSKNTSTTTYNNDPDVSGFYSAEDFYDYYYDDFFNYDDAEYYYIHGGR